MEMHDQPKAEIDWFISLASTAMLIGAAITIAFAPEWSAGVIQATFGFITNELGIAYIIVALSAFAFLVWVGCSRWGKLVLSTDQSARPVYSRFSWAAMLFCTGIGASLIYWGAMEWVYYYVDPPFGVEPRTDAAARWAASYGIFHWGPVGWALYCLPAVALGCSYHLRNIPVLRLSAACASVLGDKTDHWPGRIIDLLFLFGLLGSAATGLGFSTSVVSASVTELTGIANNFALQLTILLIVTTLIAYSVYRGLDDGIKVLSTFNATLALILIAFVFLIGPTRFILEMGVNSIGTVLQNFISMATWTDPQGRASFVESWTVFYWSWWIALGPFVGMFVCKISEGRTIREVIFGMLGWGSLGCASFFIVLGNHALYQEMHGLYQVVEQVQAHSPSDAIASMIGRLPFGGFWLAYLAVIGLIFTATTYDSASYTLAAGTSRRLQEHEHPRRWHRVFWAVMLGVLPTALLFLGGLQVLQTASIVASMPLLVIYVMMCVSIVRMLQAHAAGISD